MTPTPEKDGAPNYSERPNGSPHRECISHHFACDCREARFRELEAENKRLIYALNQAGCYCRIVGPGECLTCKALKGTAND